MSERKLKILDFFFFLNLPTMYKDMLGCFNECKRLIDISELSNATIMK